MPNGHSLWRTMARRATYGAVALGSLMASYIGVSAWQHQRQAAAATVPEEDDGPPVNPFAAENGKHLIAYVITASDCGWSTLPATMNAVGSIREKLRATHGAAYASVSVVGVVLDRDLEAGLDFLSDLGRGRIDGAFDQVIAGGSWLNEQVVRFVWREGIAGAISPQVILLERPVNTEAYLTASTIGVENDRLLANPRGSSEIIRWIDLGLPLAFAHEAPAPPAPQEGSG